MKTDLNHEHFLIKSSRAKKWKFGDSFKIRLLFGSCNLYPSFWQHMDCDRSSHSNTNAIMRQLRGSGGGCSTTI